jgi:hypothetical protein
MTHLNLLRLSRQSECLGRRAHGKRLMWAAIVVEADPVADSPGCMLDAVEALSMDALLLQCPDHTLDHAVLLRAMWGDELLLQALASVQRSELAAGKNQAVVRPQKEFRWHSAQGAELGDKGMLQLTGSGCGFDRARQMPAQ